MKNKNNCEINTNENSDTYAPKKQIIFTYEIAINNKFAQAIENASPVRASSRVIELR
jgi:hypothetical protein